MSGRPEKGTDCYWSFVIRVARERWPEKGTDCLWSIRLFLVNPQKGTELDLGSPPRKGQTVAEAAILAKQLFHELHDPKIGQVGGR